MALILSYYKNIPFLDTFMKKGLDQQQLNYVGSELAGKTMGIIGLGSIGKKVAAFCHAFDMNKHFLSFLQISPFDQYLPSS